MSTRSNIVILNGESRVILYRHYDGYLAETGKDIAHKLIQAEELILDKNELLESFLTDKRYEFTDQIHGDIEYLYEIHLGNPLKFFRNSRTSEVNIRWNDRNRSRVAGLRKDWTNLANLDLQSPNEFAGSVNDAIEEMNSIIRAQRMEDAAIQISRIRHSKNETNEAA